MYIITSDVGVCCFKFNIEDIEVSVSCEKLGYENIYNKCAIALFKGNDDITKEITGKDFIGLADGKDLVDIIDRVNNLLKKGKGKN